MMDSDLKLQITKIAQHAPPQATATGFAIAAVINGLDEGTHGDNSMKVTAYLSQMLKLLEPLARDDPDEKYPALRDLVDIIGVTLRMVNVHEFLEQSEDAPTPTTGAAVE